MTATLEETRTAISEDGIIGYAVCMNVAEETSAREAVEIITQVAGNHMTMGIDRVVTLVVERPSERIGIFSERGAEMITIKKYLDTNDQVVLYPLGYTDIPAGAIKVIQ